MGDHKWKLTGTIVFNGGQFGEQTGDFLGVYVRAVGIRLIANLRGTNEKIEIVNPVDGVIVGGTVNKIYKTIFVLPTGQDKIESVLIGIDGSHKQSYSRSDTFYSRGERGICNFISDPTSKTWYVT